MATKRKKSSAKKSTKKAARKKTTRKPARRTTARKSAKKTSRKKAARRPAAKKRTAKRTAKRATKKRTKRAPNPAFMKPVQPDAQLAEVVGGKPMPRTEITSKLWSYIKRNGLQDPQERRMINADAKLRPVFGGKNRVSMFEMTKLVNRHVG